MSAVNIMRSGTLALSLALLLAIVWEVFGRFDAQSAFFFSFPSAILSDLWVYATRDNLWLDIRSTAIPALQGLALGVAFGGSLGFALATMPRMASSLRPVMGALAAFPIFVLAPMTLLWFAGDFDSGKVFLAFVSCVFVFANAAYNGGTSVPRRLLSHLRVHGFSTWGQLLKLRLPFALDWLLDSLRLGTNLALLGVFIGEYVIADHGLAKVMLVEAGRYNMPRALAAAVCFTLLALLFASLAHVVRGLRRPILRWLSVSRTVRNYGE